MDLSPKAILKIAKDNGWELVRINGSHHIFRHQETGHTVPIPIRGNRDLKLGTFRAIVKILQNPG